MKWFKELIRIRHERERLDREEESANVQLRAWFLSVATSPSCNFVYSHYVFQMKFENHNLSYTILPLQGIYHDKDGRGNYPGGFELTIPFPRIGE